MLKIVTSHTRENIPHTFVPKIASSVLSVVINSAREPQNMKLIPYDDVLQFNEAQGLRIKRSKGRFKAIDRLGFSDKVYHATEAAARIAYWQMKVNGSASTSPKRGSRNVRANKTIH